MDAVGRVEPVGFQPIQAVQGTILQHTRSILGTSFLQDPHPPSGILAPGDQAVAPAQNLPANTIPSRPQQNVPLTTDVFQRSVPLDTTTTPLPNASFQPPIDLNSAIALSTNVIRLSFVQSGLATGPHEAVIRNGVGPAGQNNVAPAAPTSPNNPPKPISNEPIPIPVAEEPSNPLLDKQTSPGVIVPSTQPNPNPIAPTGRNVLSFQIAQFQRIGQMPPVPQPLRIDLAA